MAKVTTDTIEDRQPEGICLEDDCDFGTEPSKVTNTLAKAHTLVTGHRTRTTRSRVIEYIRLDQ